MGKPVTLRRKEALMKTSNVGLDNLIERMPQLARYPEVMQACQRIKEHNFFDAETAEEAGEAYREMVHAALWGFKRQATECAHQVLDCVARDEALELLTVAQEMGFPAKGFVRLADNEMAQLHRGNPVRVQGREFEWLVQPADSASVRIPARALEALTMARLRGMCFDNVWIATPLPMRAKPKLLDSFVEEFKERVRGVRNAALVVADSVFEVLMTPLDPVILVSRQDSPYLLEVARWE